MARVERLRSWAKGAVSAMVQTVGANAVALKVPVPAGASDADELGLVASGFSEVLLAPVLVREVGAGVSVLVSADVLHAALRLNDASAVRRAVMDCGGVSVRGAWMFVRDVEVREIAGEAYLYRMELTAAEGNA